MDNKETYTELFKLVEKLKNAEDPKRKYEFILWLGKKLKVPDNSILIPENKVQGCVSEVFVKASCLLYTSPSPRDRTRSRMPSSA